MGVGLDGIALGFPAWAGIERAGGPCESSRAWASPKARRPDRAYQGLLRGRGDAYHEKASVLLREITWQRD